MGTCGTESKSRMMSKGGDGTLFSDVWWWCMSTKDYSRLLEECSRCIIPTDVVSAWHGKTMVGLHFVAQVVHYLPNASLYYLDCTL